MPTWLPELETLLTLGLAPHGDPAENMPNFYCDSVDVSTQFLQVPTIAPEKPLGPNTTENPGPLQTATDQSVLTRSEVAVNSTPLAIPALLSIETPTIPIPLTREGSIRPHSSTNERTGVL